MQTVVENRRKRSQHQSYEGFVAQELVARTDLLNSSMEALLSAALGLGVTIPVLVMYGVLRVRMERIVVELEAAASQITGYFAAAREAKK